MTPCHRTASTAHSIFVLRPDADELLHSEALMSGDGKKLGDDAASEEHGDVTSEKLRSWAEVTSLPHFLFPLVWSLQSDLSYDL